MQREPLAARLARDSSGRALRVPAAVGAADRRCVASPEESLVIAARDEIRIGRLFRLEGAPGTPECQ